MYVQRLRSEPGSGDKLWGGGGGGWKWRKLQDDTRKWEVALGMDRIVGVGVQAPEEDRKVRTQAFKTNKQKKEVKSNLIGFE